MTAGSNIVLVGFMGTGKSSVGRRLAAMLGMRFVDMDDAIEQRAGKPIPRIFAEDGEPHFRALERALVADLSRQSGLIIATGGGVVLNPDNIRDFSAGGLVVCLWANAGTILARVGHETHRPLLAGDDKMANVRGLMDARRKLYEAIPLRVDTDTLSVDQAAERVLRLYRARTDATPHPSIEK